MQALEFRHEQFHYRNIPTRRTFGYGETLRSPKDLTIIYIICKVLCVCSPFVTLTEECCVALEGKVPTEEQRWTITGINSSCDARSHKETSVD